MVNLVMFDTIMNFVALNDNFVCEKEFNFLVGCIPLGLLMSGFNLQLSNV